MFNNKKQSLFQVGKSPNAFLRGASVVGNITLSENGSTKFKSTGDSFVDQFGSLGSYKEPRSFNDIAGDCEKQWADDKLTALKFIFFTRAITRSTTLIGYEKSFEQKGAELKHEGIMRMIWLHLKSPKTFWKNITLFISVGSWKDIITMLSYDLQYNGWEGRKLDWNKFSDLILSGLSNEGTSELIKKYLPQIKSNSSCKTLEAQADNLIAKWVCSLLFGNKGETSGHTYKMYRKLKSSGTAHEWQKLISKRQYHKIDFSKIHGRALSLLVRGKFLDTSGLRNKYSQWASDDSVKEIKYTGFVSELFAPFKTVFDGWNVHRRNQQLITSIPNHIIDTVNKQFMTLVSKGGNSPGMDLIVCRDTSGSMRATANGTSQSCFDIAKSLALYFSYFIKGEFSDSYIEFSKEAVLRKWKGHSPLEKWCNDHENVVGNTNFNSIIDLFCILLKSGVPESDFPSGILCISDGEFDRSHLNSTAVGAALRQMKAIGFSNSYINNFKIILWNLSRGNTTKFETANADFPNVYYFSGYSPSVISFLNSGVKNAGELVNESLNQPILNLLSL